MTWLAVIPVSLFAGGMLWAVDALLETIGKDLAVGTDREVFQHGAIIGAIIWVLGWFTVRITWHRDP